MNQDTSHKLVWGWLRLFLGWLQMSLAAAGFGALLVLGHHPLTWALAIAALVAVVISRLLYHGKPDPKLRQPQLATTILGWLSSGGFVMSFATG